MNPEERKCLSEGILQSRNIPINEWLPLSGGKEDMIAQDAQAVGRRIIILLYLIYSGETGDREQPCLLLRESGLWPHISPNEQDLLLRDEWSEQEEINVSWKVECVKVFLWATGKIAALEFPSAPCSPQSLLELVPAFMEDPGTFIRDCTLRTMDELLDETDFIYRLHWAVRQAQLTGADLPQDTDPGVVHERHYALNWLLQFNDSEEEWDDISTDT